MTMEEDVKIREGEETFVSIKDSITSSLKNVDKEYNRLRVLKEQFDTDDDFADRRTELNALWTTLKTQAKAFIDNM